MKYATIFLAVMAMALAAFPLAADEDRVLNVRIHVLIFELDEKVAHFLLSERTNDTELFGELMSRYKEDEASIVASASVVTRSGQRAKVEAVHEVMYATEFEERKDGGVKPVALEVRNVGTTVEVDPVIGADGETIDVNIAPEHHLAPPVMRQLLLIKPGEEDEEDKKLTTPEFFVEKITTATTLRDGEARLLGTVDPGAILEGSGEEASVEGKLHLFFLRADLVH